MTRIRGNHTSALAALAVVVLLATATVLATGTNALAAPVGALATTADALDTDGPDGGFWRGSHLLTAATFTGTVDFAVFGPGDFQTYLDGEYGDGTYTDPTGDGEYIYAYQFRSDSGATIQTLNAGYDVGTDIGSLPAPSSMAASGNTGPTTTSYNASSARWDWGFGASVANTQISDLLFYSSNRPPKPDFATLGAEFLLDQADSGPNEFASPSVPEPASLVGMIVALVSMGLVTGRRRK